MFKTNRDIFNFLKEPSFSGNAELILEEMIRQSKGPIAKNNLELLKGKIDTFCSHLRKRWVESRRTRSKFYEKNENWLNRDFVYPEWTLDDSRCSEFVPKPFSECSDRHKSRRVENLRNEYSGEELLFAAKMKLRQEGKRDAAKIIEQLLRDLDVPKISHEFCEMEESIQQCFTNDKALSLYTVLDLSRSKYNALRDITMSEGLDIFPSYYQVGKAKVKCYPGKEFIHIDERTATVELQGLLDHTVARILATIDLDEAMLSEPPRRELTLITKWGCDGSSGHSIYKQPFRSPSGSDENSDDSSIFLTTLVPIKLVDPSNSKIIWENLSPSSTDLCRPLRFKFCKETADVIREEVHRVGAEIDSLIPTQMNSLIVNHQLHLTMIDGKVCNVITDTASTLRCNICGATVKEMNDIEHIEEKIPQEEYYKFGIPPLHAKIKFFECLLHVSFNMDFKSWSATSDEQKKLRKLRKDSVQEKFRTVLGLHVDRVKQGVGNFNDGNTARRFFEDPETTAELTGLDEELITRFAVVLQTLSCTQWVNPIKFGHYAKDTAKRFVDLYGWYYMPPTVHKVLIHGAKIIEHAAVPIGTLSEEAQEALNKNFRQARQFNTRKMSRISTNEDILHHLLISSDPYVSFIKPPLCRQRKVKNALFPEAFALLENFPDIPNEEEEDTAEPMDCE